MAYVCRLPSRPGLAKAPQDHLSLAPLEAEYYRDVKTQQEGQRALARWSAARAAGEAGRCIQETLQLLHSAAVFEKLGMFSCRTQVCEEDSWVQEELAMTHRLFLMLTETASARAWSECMYRVQLPQLAAGLLHENRDAAQGMCNKMARIAKAVLAAEKVVGNAHVNTCLADAAWPKLQLARELMKMGQDGARFTRFEKALNQVHILARQPCL